MLTIKTSAAYIMQTCLIHAYINTYIHLFGAMAENISTQIPQTL